MYMYGSKKAHKVVADMESNSKAQVLEVPSPLYYPPPPPTALWNLVVKRLAIMKP